MMRIETLGLGLKRGSRDLLRDVTLSVDSGVLSVIGPNGAGKTTLLRILALLDKPGAGRVLYDGRPADRLSARGKAELRRKMGFVFQHPLLLNGSVLDNMRYALKVRRRTVDETRIAAALAAAGLAGQAALDVRVLSGGEKQRLQLARVMILDADVLLADEPTSNLDPLSARFIEDLLQAMAGAGKTVILTTHNLIQARLLGGKMAFLKDGRVLQQGPAQEVLRSPATLDVAHFAPITNVLRGRLVRTAGESVLEIGGTRIHVVTTLDDGPVAAVIGPEDILLSLEPLQSSARNSLSARVEAVDDLGIVVLVKAAGPDLSLRAAITRTSLQELGIRAGDRVILTFKASAVILFPDYD